MCAEFFKAYGQKINLEIRGPPKAFMGVQIEHDVGKGTRHPVDRDHSSVGMDLVHDPRFSPAHGAKSS